MEEKNKINIDLVRGFKLFLSSNSPKKNMNVTDNQFGSLIEKSTGGAVKQLSSLNLGSSDIDGIVSKARNGASSVLEKMAETNSSFDLENMKKNIDNGANTAMTSQGWTFVTKVSSSCNI